jgi:competence protein ComEA
MFRAVLPVVTWACLIGFISPSLSAQEKAPARAASSKASAAKSPVNINTATAAELQSLPGIGARTAARIIEYRQKNGPFKKVEELMNVRGVGEKSFLKLKPQLTLGQSKTDH